MNKTKKALASLAIAGMTLSMVPFNVFAADTVSTRIAGVTAAQTAVQIADQTGWTGKAILASSLSYGMVDALTAGPLASYLNAPILLTGAGNTLDAATKDELTKLDVKTVYVTSGTAVISQGVIDELKGMNITVEQLGGYDRFETSVNIAKKMVGVTKVAVANGLQDALSIASIASADNQPILVTAKDALPASVAAYLAANPGITASDVIGGTGVISDAVKNALPSATRHAGYTAYDTNNQVIQDFNSSLEYDSVYVASGVTGIDALAGAPLAAQTKSAIVLTDGKSVPAVAAFTHSKSNASTVVTALGGTAVVPESVRVGVANGNVTSVPGALAINSVVSLDESNRFIEINFNKAVTGLQATDIVVAHADTLDRYGVKNVQLSSNGQTATIELYAAEDSGVVLQSLQDYNITINANGTVLNTTFNRPAFAKDRILEVNIKDRKFVVFSSFTNKTETIKVPSTVNFDFYNALGREARVWFNADRNMVSQSFVAEEVIEDAIEVTKTRTSSADGEIKLKTSGDKYDLAKDFTFYLDGNKVTNVVDGDKYEYAKTFFNKSGDIELMIAYTWDDTFVVKTMDGNVAISYDDDELNLKDYMIFKDGKQISTSDLAKGDIVYFSSKANNEDGVAEVYNNSVTGEIENVYDTSFNVDGKNYTYTSDDTKWLDKDKFKKVTSNDAKDFQAGGVVTLFLDRQGDLRYLTGTQEAVASNTVAGHLVENIVAYNETGIANRGTIELELLNENNEEHLYKFNPSSLDSITYGGNTFEAGDPSPTDATKEIDEFQVKSNGAGLGYSLVATHDGGGEEAIVNLHNAFDNTIIELTFDDNGNIEDLEFLDTKDMDNVKLELDNVYAKSGGVSYRLKSDTVVFDGSTGFDNTYNPDADDITVTTWGDLKSSKSFDITDAKFVVDGNDVKYLVIEQTTASEDATFENAIVTKVLRNTDGEVVEITAWVNGEKKVFAVDEIKTAFSNAIGKGHAVILEVNDGTGVVEGIKAPVEDTNQISGVISEIRLGSKEVKVGGEWYELVSDGYVLDATNPSDITKKLFRDLDVNDKVVIQLDEDGALFAEAIVIVK